MAEEDPFAILTATINSTDPSLLSISSSTEPTLLPSPITTTWSSSSSSPFITQPALPSPAGSIVDVPSSTNHARAQPRENESRYMVSQESICNDQFSPVHKDVIKVRERHHPYSRTLGSKNKKTSAPTSAPGYHSGQNISHRQHFLCEENPVSTENQYLFNLHHDQTFLALGIQQHLSRLIQTCEEMQRFLQEGFSESDKDGDMPLHLEIEKYLPFLPLFSYHIRLLFTAQRQDFLADR